MPSVYLRRPLYDTLVRKGLNIPEFVNEAVKDKLEKLKEE